MKQQFPISNFQFSKNKKYIKKIASGQVVLILVLVTVVGLAVGLSLISRTISDIRMSSQLEQASRAYSAAEAGVETALRKEFIALPTPFPITLPGATASYVVDLIGQTSDVYTLSLTDSGTTQTIWLAGHDDKGEFTEGSPYPVSSLLDICWGSSTSNAALIMSLFYRDGIVYKVSKLSYDAVGTRGNNFLTPESGGFGYCDGNYSYRKSINFVTDFGAQATSVLLFIRLQPVYASTFIASKPQSGATLPLQGRTITSVGKTDTGIVRKIRVSQGYTALPSLFDYTVFSQN